MSLGDKGSGGIVTRDKVVEVFPHLARTHEDTVFHVYRELKADKNVVDLTLFYKEPDEEKQRIDGEFDLGMFDDVLLPEMVKITYWGSAVRF